MALSAYPKDFELGSFPYARRYVRRPNELVVRFHQDFEPDFEAMRDHLQSIGWRPRILEHDQRFDALHAARMTWIHHVSEDVPGGLRGVARELAQAHPIVDATPVYRPEDDDRWDEAIPLPGDLLVKIRDDALDEAVARLAALDLVYQVEVSELLGGGQRFFRLSDARPRDDGFGFDEPEPGSLLEAVLAVPGVEGVEHDWVRLIPYDGFPEDALPHDEFFGDQWNLETIGMEAAWRAAKALPGAPVAPGAVPGVPVAVIDSGFDVGHPDLNFDARALDAEKLWLDGEENANAGPSGYAHGTAVAGVVGAEVDNDLRQVGGVDVARGVASVGSGCPIVPIRLGDTPSSGRVATALAWARREGVRVVSMSLTVVETSAVASEVDAAWEAEMVLCAATGNRPPDYGARSAGFPARHLYVIGVGASDEDDDRCERPPPGNENWQSRFGDGVDVVAPGVRIWTTDERQAPAAGFNPPPANWSRGGNGEPLWFGGTTDDGVGFGPDPEYLAVFSGTSAATPHVAGLASLILACRQDLTAEGVRNLIERTCYMPLRYRGALGAHPKRISSASNPLAWNIEVGCGRIDAAAALAEIGDDPDLPAIALHPDPCVGNEQVVLVGYVGRGPGAKWRVYATPTLDRWTEVAEADIVGSDQLPLAGSRVYVRPGAEIRRVIVSYVNAGATLSAR